MEILKTEIPGLFHIKNFHATDTRGFFVKTFHKEVFSEAGISFSLAESFYSVSHRAVVRGMHFQEPPYAQAKLVCCVSGEIEDVVLDIRVGSPTYGKALGFRLSGTNYQALFIPEGLAHGFQSLQDGSITLYYVNQVNVPTCDKGIRYDSFGYPWPLSPGPISRRDLQWPPLKDFVSPYFFNS
ncbi:MAG: dTDP-4-dehydrorhamnose 3,5-epimerase family protein [Flavobacteriales bacterium]|nr:dTDP-4-dehydrorhamnose 3,5-epimerase family protein [Flavobacteriales bacterium]MCX7769058.1 dTDP-4-dehydrorhamnose 3,5-epimerase family protein [Flavobacteriales bacterium]MDW8410333.1 dTDP-4-dehydrorhamnose 3,5-epimerase family protein [Flavobacteriales bacterium]